MAEVAIGKSDQWQKIFGYILGYQATWIADIGLKAEFFRTIGDLGKTGVDEERLAEQMGFDRRYVEVWCRAAYAFEYLDWDEAQGYRLAPHMASLLLDSADPQFMGGRVQFQAALYEDFKAYPEYLRRGDVWPRSEHDPWILEALKNLTKPDADRTAAHARGHSRDRTRQCAADRTSDQQRSVADPPRPVPA